MGYGLLDNHHPSEQVRVIHLIGIYLSIPVQANKVSYKVYIIQGYPGLPNQYQAYPGSLYGYMLGDMEICRFECWISIKIF